MKYELKDVGLLLRNILKVKSPAPKELTEWNEAFNTKQCSLDDLVSEYDGTGLKPMIHILCLIMCEYCADSYQEIPGKEPYEKQDISRTSNLIPPDRIPRGGIRRLL
jgi:hypothetical protein